MKPEVADIAAEWAVKVDAGPLDPGEQAALEAWLEASSRHAGAFARARAALEYAGPDQLAGVVIPPTDKLYVGLHSRRGAVGLGLGLAASVTVSVVAAWRLLGRPSYSTGVGETRIVPLDDGSVVTLNTNSQIAVNYTEARREIRLLQGEALFDVAKNKARPFIVLAKDTQVRAVGTSFTVRMLSEQPVQVLVREGVVEVKRPGQPAAPAARLPANTKGIVPLDAPIVALNVPQAEVSRALAWRVGRIAFEGESLKEAAAEFARYSETQIEIDAPDVENQTVAGLFVSNDPVGFSKAVSASFGLKMTVSGQKIRLSH